MPTIIQPIAVVCPDLIGRIKIVDGDSFWCWMEQLYRRVQWIEFRLGGVDCPEKRSPAGHKITSFEKRRALDAQKATEMWFLTAASKGRIFIETDKDPEKYGRWLATMVWSETPDDQTLYLQDHLMALQLAVPSDGSAKWRDTYDRPVPEELEHADPGRETIEERSSSAPAIQRGTSGGGPGAPVILLD